MYTWVTTQTEIKMVNEYELKTRSNIMEKILYLSHSVDLIFFQPSKHFLCSCDDDRCYLAVSIYDYHHGKYNKSDKAHCVNCTLMKHMVLKLSISQVKQRQRYMLIKMMSMKKKWKQQKLRIQKYIIVVLRN